MKPPISEYHRWLVSGEGFSSSARLTISDSSSSDAMTAQTQEELLAAHLEQQKINVKP